MEILQVHLSDVSGFYSEWSPSVTTNMVKVLAKGKEQAVVPSDGCIISPPRLGRVGDGAVSVITRRPLDLKQNLEPQVPASLCCEDDLAEDAPTEEIDQQEATDLRPFILSQLVKNEKAILSLKVPLWLIVIALVILVLR